jgi:leucyl-tRNA synthetase
VEDASPKMLKDLHKAIKKVSSDFNEFKFNTAIASLMELTNAIYQTGADQKVFCDLVIMLSPIVPHFAEELWEILGHKESIFKCAWPQYDPQLLVEENIEMPIQINGKLRSKIEVVRNISEVKLKELVLADQKVISWLEGKSPKKFIVIPQKLVNIVI